MTRLSIFDQAIAHGAGTVEWRRLSVRCSGLADRARIIDLFEMLMRGDVASALREFRAQYDVGADPSVVLTDLADFNHLVTRIRFTPDVADDISLSEDERTARPGFCRESLSIRVLSRTWQMLLKGMAEVDSSSRPVQAAEMLLDPHWPMLRTLPTLDEALKSLDDGAVPCLVPPAPRSDGPRPNPGNGGADNGTCTSRRGCIVRAVTVNSNGGATMRLVEPAIQSPSRLCSLRRQRC